MDRISNERSPQPQASCPICAQAMPARLTTWTFYCSDCDYWSSSLQPVTAELEQDEFLSERKHEENPINYLDQLREQNFKTCLQLIASCSPPHAGKVLEVGCGTGLFLDEASRAGFDIMGIEAFEEMARQGLKQGRPIRVGFFPDCLQPDERFAAIVFNDVFEHLPDAAQMLSICHRQLQPGGVLVLNLPNSRGPFYRLAKIAYRFRIRSPWERLWQKMFFTPHLHYFSPASLEALCAQNNFTPCSDTVHLRSITMKGLWARIQADATMSLPMRLLVWSTTAVLSVIIPLFESDCTVRVFRRR